MNVQVLVRSATITVMKNIEGGNLSERLILLSPTKKKEEEKGTEQKPLSSTPKIT